MRIRPKAVRLPLHQADFDALPDSVQRKYFSSLERLQIHHRSSSTDDPPSSGRSSRASSSTPFHPSRSLPSGHRRIKSDKPPLLHDVSQAQADFFHSLPEKVRRQHFSNQEQLLLQARCGHTVLPAQQSLERAQQRFDDFRFDFPDTPPSSPPERGRSRRRSSSVSSITSPGRASFTLPIEKEKAKDSISTPANPWLRLNMISTPMFTTKEVPKRTMRRAMSMTSTSVPLPHGSLADGSLLLGLNTGPRPAHQRAYSSSVSGRRSSHIPELPAFDPEAAHYQDPEARKKLRMYLASPQKFDEAIEFGFPSSAGSHVVAPHYQLPHIRNHSRKFSRDMHTFLREGKLSFFDDGGNENQGLDSDSDSVAEMDSPTTPSSIAQSFRFHARQVSRRAFSLDSSNTSPGPRAHGQVQMNREMTLRMTLTRPDLRAEEEQLYPWQSSNTPRLIKDDPLALEDLVLTDDMTGTKGPFYVKPKARDSLVTRFLKRASLKAR
ncbi:hypothetical protein ACN47E_010158 [Coniothyrium glycines]